MAFHWYVAQTYPNAEASAERRLNRQLFATHLPRRTTRTLRLGKIVERAGPCFPGYLFVPLDVAGETWKGACYTRGVLRLLPISERPLRVATCGPASSCGFLGHASCAITHALTASRLSINFDTDHSVGP
jgi:transcription antitermination factor NusG